MSNEQQCGQSFGCAVIGKVTAGKALEQSGLSADDFLGLGADLYATGQETNGQPIQLDGCALKAE
jgi:hypothetical protein